jgi:hypothetical protein
MMIWYLIFWSVLVPPFEGGQYQTEQRCRAAAQYQLPIHQKAYGPLKWKCGQKIGIG